MENENIIVLAVGAHPDDVEFGMAGTLLLLKQHNAEIHIWTISNGNCGSDSLPENEIAAIRINESACSAGLAGAEYHKPITNDLEIFYEKDAIKKASAIIRKIKPSIILLPSPEDYMEDHQNACRIVVTAAFTRGMRNYITIPDVSPWYGNTVLYHAMPHGLKNGMRRHIRPGQYVNISSVIDRKIKMLECHKSQKEWLDVSQGMDSYISTMKSMSEAVGKMSERFEYAEGWRRHLHLGMSDKETDTLSVLLGDDCIVDNIYENSLEF